MPLQNFTGVGVAKLLGLDPLIGMLGGSGSLIVGHGTTIAWAPVFAEEFGIENASEIGIACATCGLVLASLMGGPIARILIRRNQLKSTEVEALDVGIQHDTTPADINHLDILRTLLWLNVSLALGSLIQQGLASAGLQLPLFVCCLFGGILLTNSVPRICKRLVWPSGSNSLVLVSDLSLGVFLTMSLMSLQLWTIAELALATIFALFVVFRLMGRDYEAAVVSAGFGGISLGATPTAMANMTAVAMQYGPAHRAFIIVPLVSGFFVDISNALVIQTLLRWLV